jgi:hypothetical protein
VCKINPLTGQARKRAYSFFLLYLTLTPSPDNEQRCLAAARKMTLVEADILLLSRKETKEMTTQILIAMVVLAAAVQLVKIKQ